MAKQFVGSKSSLFTGQEERLQKRKKNDGFGDDMKVRLVERTPMTDEKQHVRISMALDTEMHVRMLFGGE